jgi:5-carboxymethyl-2-hydroxymuconate isomerase
MPHLLLEYTGNIQAKINFKVLFSTLHTLLFDVAKAEIPACKSRATRLEDYFVGDGNSNNSFAHLDIMLMAGRTPEAKKQLGEKALAILRDFFQESAKERNLQITVKVTDMPAEFYFKTSTQL